MEQPGTRLNKFLAMHLHVGRRAADDLIMQGKVQLNNKTPELGARVHSGDTVTVKGKQLQFAETPFLYVLIDKPTNYVCSRRQQGDTPTIYSLLPKEYAHLKTVGRLDKNSSGVLLLTNDGDLAHRLTHPSFHKIKQYDVILDVPLSPLHHQMISDIGITLPDGTSKLQLERLHDGDDTQWHVRMHEGRNRQIRRTFAALGYTVQELRRTHFGPFALTQLDGHRLLPIEKPHNL